MAADEQDFVVLNPSDIQDFNEEGVLPLSAKKLADVQKWLAPTDYAAASSEYGKHSASHLAGTGSWVLQADQYQQWHDSDKGVLWVKAIAGAGKSVIAASLISKLAAERVPVLYFFFRHIVSANQTPRSLVRDYMSQLLEYSPELQHSLYKLIDDRRSLDTVSLSQLWKMLVSALSQLPRVYCVADALDEMDLGNETFLQDLLELGRKKPTTIKVLITSRPLPRVEQIFRDPYVLQILLQPQLINPDISTYVLHRVNHHKHDISETTRSRIHDTMCAKADGHFLYARLMMDDLLDPSKDLLARETDLAAALAALPTPMAEMYSTMLLDHSDRSGVSQSLQLVLLQWVTRAERPLRLLELSSMIDFQQNILGINNNTKNVVREACGPLLEILDDETVCPIHHSFTEYLYDATRRNLSAGTNSFPVLEYATAHRDLALTCLKYLNSGWQKSYLEGSEPELIEDKRTTLKLQNPFLEYAANNWHKHLRTVNARDDLIVSELDGLLANDSQLLRAWLQLTAPPRSPFVEQGAGLLESRTPLHTSAEIGLGFYIDHLVASGHSLEDTDAEGHTAIALAARNGHDAAVDALLRNGAKSDEDDSVGYKPMHLAAMKNHHAVVKLLLANGVDPFTPKTKEFPGRFCGNAPTSVGDTPLFYACQNGHTETVKEFVPYLNQDGLDKALCWTLRFGQSKAALALLKTPNINVNCFIASQSPLFLASTRRETALMRLLLRSGADPNTLSSNYFPHGGVPLGRFYHTAVISPLYAFASADGDYRPTHSSWDAVIVREGFEILLDAGLDPNLFHPDGFTILHALMSSDSNIYSTDRVRHGIEDVLSYLFGRGLSALALARDGSNALHLASGVSNAAIDMLVSCGVDLNHIRKSDGKTPLMSAISRKDLNIASALLDHGADANIADLEGNTPLHYLAQISNLQLKVKLVKRLISAGADVNQRNKDGDTPMHLSTRINSELFNLFLEYGFDTEAKNKKGHTILFRSIKSGSYDDLYKKLIDWGASPFTLDSYGATLLHLLSSQVNNIGPRTSEKFRYLVQKGVDPLAQDSLGNTLWHYTARQGAGYYPEEQLAVMKLLMEYGVSPLTRNHAGRTALHDAVSMRSHSAEHGPFEFIIEQRSTDINAADYDKICPIHLTASFDFELTCSLLELGADPTKMTIEGQSPLMVACRTRQCNIVYMLLDNHQKHDQSFMVDRVDNQGCSALHYACKSGRPETVAILLDAGANTGIMNKQGLTPLHICAEYLDEQKAWENTLTFNEYQPIREGAAYVLLSQNMRPLTHNQHEDPIRIRETIRLLINNGADTSFLIQPTNRWKLDDPLAHAIRKGCEPMLNELLVIRERLLQAKRSTSTELLEGAEGPSLSTEEESAALMKQWIKRLATYTDQSRFLRLQHMPNIIAELVEPGKNNLELVLQLLEEDNEPAVEEISKLGADLFEFDDYKHSPLFKITSYGYTDLMRNVGQDAVKMDVAWLEMMATKSRNFCKGRLNTILHTALSRQIPNLAMVKLLVSEFKVNLNEQFVEGSYDLAPTLSYVHFLAQPRHWWQTKALQYLLDQGAEVDPLNSDKETPLIFALRKERFDISTPAQVQAVEILLRHGANPNVLDKDGLTCLNLAAGQPKCIKLLLQHGASISSGYRPFIFDAIEGQDIDTLRLIVETGTDVNVLYQPKPELIPDEGERELIYGLFGNDGTRIWSHINDVDEFSCHAYPIHLAASHIFNTEEKKEKATKIIELLLKAGADPYLIYDEGKSILHVLAEHNGILEPFMEEASFDPEVRDSRGRTLLLAACDYLKSDKPLPLKLLERGASLTATDNNDRNALHCLISALPSALDIQGNTVPSALLDPFVPILVPGSDHQGRTPFHYALAKGRFDLIDTLLLNGADPLAPDPQDGSTALHHLAKGLASYQDLLYHDPEMLLTSDFVDAMRIELACMDPSSEEVRQFLHTKFFDGDALVSAKAFSPRRHITSLMKRGLSINAQDSAGGTPVYRLLAAKLNDKLVENGHLIIHVLEFLETAGADFKVRNGIGESVLHKLAGQTFAEASLGRERVKNHAKGYELIVKWLLDRGLDITWEDENNRTCLDVAAATGADWMLELCKRK